MESGRPVIFTAGLVFAWACTLTAFEWRTQDPLLKLPSGNVIKPIEPEYLSPIITNEERIPQIQPVVTPAVLQQLSSVIIILTETPADEDGDIPDSDTQVVASYPNSYMVPESEPEKEEDNLRSFPMVMPEYPGGEPQLLQDLANRLEYPDESRLNGISGVVYVSYVVNRKGEVTAVKVLRSVDPFLDREAVRVVMTLRDYTAGRQAGHPLNVPFTVPIRFVLCN